MHAESCRASLAIILSNVDECVVDIQVSHYTYIVHSRSDNVGYTVLIACKFYFSHFCTMSKKIGNVVVQQIIDTCIQNMYQNIRGRTCIHTHTLYIYIMTMQCSTCILGDCTLYSLIHLPMTDATMHVHQTAVMHPLPPSPTSHIVKTLDN